MRIGIVFWKDAVLFSEPAEPQLIDCFAVGAIKKEKDMVVVYHNFSNGQWDVFLAIPNSWVVKIIYTNTKIKEVKNESKASLFPSQLKRV
jgi:hypothetical protein